MHASNVARLQPCTFARSIRWPSVVCPADFTHLGSCETSRSSVRNRMGLTGEAFNCSSNERACSTEKAYEVAWESTLTQPSSTIEQVSSSAPSVACSHTTIRLIKGMVRKPKGD